MKTSPDPKKVPLNRLEKKAKEQKLVAERKKLSDHFTDAIQFLKTTALPQSIPAHGPHTTTEKKQKIINLPWFLMIGAEKTGKTSLLQHSGLKFLLTKKTKKNTTTHKPYAHHCEWWGTRDAVILDIPGNYILQDNRQPKDKLYWIDFLQLLRKHRYPPMNGLIIVISLETLLVQTKHQQQRAYQNIKKRLVDLKQQLKTPFPVYVVLSKCDMLVGFNEFFSTLSSQERQQVWGIGLTKAQVSSRQHIVDTFDVEFDALVKRLNDRLITRLHQERTQHKRDRVSDFPLQVESLKKPLITFLQLISGLTTAKTKTPLRGIYFTSASPQEQCIDQLLVPLTRAFHLELATATASQPKADTAFFTQRLFTDVLFRDVDYFDERAKTQHKVNRWVRYFSIAASVILVVICTTKWSQHLIQHAQRVSQTEAAVTHYQLLAKKADLTEPDQFINALNALQQATQNLQTKPEHWLDAVELVETKKLPTIANASYHQAIEVVLLTTLQQALQQQLSPQTPRDPAVLYQTLKTYLMLADPTHFNPDMMRAWFNQHWQAQLSADANLNAQMQMHLTAWLEQSPNTITLDARLIQTARATLNQLSIPQQTLMVLQDYESEHPYTLLLPFINTNNNHFFAAGSKQITVPAIFTAKNFLNTYESLVPTAVNSALYGNWVLGKKSPSQPAMRTQQWIEEAQDNYLNAYISTWQQILISLQFPKFSRFEEAIQLIDTLVKPNSSFTRLLIAIRDNTNITYKNVQTPISIRFQKFNKYVSNQQQQTTSLQQTLLQLQDYLSMLANAKSVEEASFNAAKKRMLGEGPDVLMMLQQQAYATPTPFNLWLSEIQENSWQLILQQAKIYIDHRWQTAVLPDYRKQIENRYPLVAKMEPEISPKAFDQFFAPHGTLDRFFTHYLAPFIDNTQNNWQLRKRDGQTLPISPATLAELRKANYIKTTFFNEHQQMAIPFTLSTDALQPIIKRLQLSLDEQEVTYTQKNQSAHALVWPGESPRHSVTLSFLSIDGKHASTTQNGTWAWFKLLDQANLQPSEDEKTIKLTFDVDGYAARARLVSNATINPFSPQLLRNFSCPVTL